MTEYVDNEQYDQPVDSRKVMNEVVALLEQYKRDYHINSKIRVAIDLVLFDVESLRLVLHDLKENDRDIYKRVVDNYFKELYGA